MNESIILQFNISILFQLYTQLNIFVVLVGVIVWSQKNEIQYSDDSDILLKKFLYYRKTYISEHHQNDYAQLLTYIFHVI